jgi:uncharacterized Zn finger protein (UPF0148 family)
VRASHNHNHCPECGAVAEAFAPETVLYTCKFCQTPFEVRHPEYRAKKREIEKLEKEHEREETEASERAEKAREGRSGLLFGLGIVAVIAVVMGGFTYYDLVVKPWKWDGHRSFSCDSGKGTITDIQATGTVSARGTCELTLVRPTLEASITASDHAIINVVGGRIHSTSTPVNAKGFGKIVLDGTVVEASSGHEAVNVENAGSVVSKKAIINGKVKSASAAGLIGFPPVASAAAAPAWRGGDMTAFVCGGVKQCLEATGGKGPVSGYMTVSFDEAGKAKGVAMSGGIAQGLGKCFLDLGGAKSIPPVSGALPGACEILCKYSGTIRSPATSLAFSSEFFSAH